MSLDRFPSRTVVAVSRWDLFKALAVVSAVFSLALLHQRGNTSAGADTGPERLTSRARPAAPPVKAAAVGDVIRTEQGQRRRVALPGGSVLFVDQNSEVRLEAANQLLQV